MNTITIAEIKRGGMDALDLALNRGAATIMKRNRPAAIVLTPQTYEALLAKSLQTDPQSGALDWLLNPNNAPTLSSAQLDGRALKKRIGDLKTDWADR